MASRAMNYYDVLIGDTCAVTERDETGKTVAIATTSSHLQSQSEAERYARMIAAAYVAA